MDIQLFHLCVIRMADYLKHPSIEFVFLRRNKKISKLIMQWPLPDVFLYTVINTLLFSWIEEG